MVFPSSAVERLNQGEHRDGKHGKTTEVQCIQLQSTRFGGFRCPDLRRIADCILQQFWWSEMWMGAVVVRGIWSESSPGYNSFSSIVHRPGLLQLFVGYKGDDAQ